MQLNGKRSPCNSNKLSPFAKNDYLKHVLKVSFTRCLRSGLCSKQNGNESQYGTDGAIRSRSEIDEIHFPLNDYAQCYDLKGEKGSYRDLKPSSITLLEREDQQDGCGG